jgi:hypothetical protein
MNWDDLDDGVKEKLFMNGLGFENWRWLDTMVKDKTSIFIEDEWDDDFFNLRTGGLFYGKGEGRGWLNPPDWSVCILEEFE